MYQLLKLLRLVAIIGAIVYIGFYSFRITHQALLRFTSSTFAKKDFNCEQTRAIYTDMSLAFENPKEVCVLDLRGSDILSIPLGITLMENLEELDMSHSSVVNVPDLSSMRSIHMVDVTDTGLSQEQKEELSRQLPWAEVIY